MLRPKMGLTLTMLACVMLLCSAPLAQADTVLALQQAGVNGGLLTIVATAGDLNPLVYSGSYGSFSVVFFGTFETNTAAFSSISSSTMTVVNTTADEATLVLYASSQGFTLPDSTPLIAESSMGGSVNIATLTGHFHAFADQNNALLGDTDFTNGVQPLLFNQTSFDTGSATGLFDRLAGPYSMTVVADLTIGGLGNVNYSNHLNMTPVPEPGTLALLGIGLVGLAIGYRRKSR